MLPLPCIAEEVKNKPVLNATQTEMSLKQGSERWQGAADVLARQVLRQPLWYAC